MGFGTGYQDDPSRVGAGERFDKDQTILTAQTFEDGLKVGLFAKLDTGSLDNMDGSATPTIAGVVTRNVASPIEDGGVIDAALFSVADYARSGLATVAVKTGETPTQFGAVFASNLGDANDGKALTAAGIATNAEFIEEVKTDVWLIRLV